MEAKHGKKPSVLQFKDGQLVGKYPTIIEASRHTGIAPSMIRRVLKGWNIKLGVLNGNMSKARQNIISVFKASYQ
jgi:hypothetical protein